MKNRFLIPLAIVYVGLVVLYFLSVDIPHKIAFPLAWLALGALFLRRPVLALACAFSALGDYADFVPKMCFFALAQVTYIVLFTRIPVNRNRRNLLLGVAFLLAWMAVLGFFLPHVKDDVIRWGVAIYSALLLFMCWLACSSGRILSALGGLLFLFSDSILGISRFACSIPSSYYLVMVPYYTGQLLLFLGFLVESGSVVDLGNVHKRT